MKLKKYLQFPQCSLNEFLVLPKSSNKDNWSTRKTALGCLTKGKINYSKLFLHSFHYEKRHIGLFFMGLNA